MIIQRLVLIASFRSAFLVGFIVFALLVGGQLFKLRAILFQVPDAGDWLGILILGSIVLAEAVIPVIALFVGGIVMGHLKQDGALLGLYAVGISPFRLLFTFVLVGCALGLLCLTSSQIAGPMALKTLRAEIFQRAQFDASSTRHQLAFPGLAIIQTEDEKGPRYWGVLGYGSEQSLVNARDVKGGLRSSGQPFVTLENAVIWNLNSLAVVRRAVIDLDPGPVTKLMAMTGPPNALSSKELNVDDVHHRFIWHKRWSFPATTPLLCVLGALLGVLLGPKFALLTGAFTIGLVYAVLRGGELAARSGQMSPALAAWCAPLFVLCVVLCLCTTVGRSRSWLWRFPLPF